MNIDEMREIIRNEIVEVIFTKKDGSERKMLCSTMSDIIPDMSGSKLSKPNDGIVTVWDIEADGWRSFRFDSVIDFKVVTYVE